MENKPIVKGYVKVLGIVSLGIALIIFVLIFCTSKKNVKHLTYEGINSNWKVNVQLNTGNDSKIFMSYIGIGETPKKINFDFEHLARNISGGVCEYSKTLNRFNVVFPNDDKLNDNIKKYNNRKSLKFAIKWNEKNEEIELKKVK